MPRFDIGNVFDLERFITDAQAYMASYKLTLRDVAAAGEMELVTLLRVMTSTNADNPSLYTVCKVANVCYLKLDHYRVLLDEEKRHANLARPRGHHLRKHELPRGV